ncbi:MAG: DUF3536 domain-containing protein [Kofleriaceae bacterium]
MNDTKWVCIHGHFYQPPRENPWLEAIEVQPSAHPYRDWNERITAECYRPNAAARVVDDRNQIIQIVDNYERMSFNVGPTLMSWLEEHAPDVHGALIEADRASQKRFGGHGSAMAQVYNHVIMPLATPRDRATQVIWGIADFRHRFGRTPEGMWLSECAVNLATLDALVEEGIRFTVLAPHQAAAWRAPGETAWRSTPIDPGRAYKCRLPSGRTIDLFFYDGPTSQAVAFERLLVDGHKIVSKMTARDPIDASAPTLCHIATDGETYGHHHRYGDMALAWALRQVERGWHHTRLTNYAEFRTAVPATWEVQLAENTSWSCVHGVERWRSDCGCNTGGRSGWNQAWRRPLRDALDWLGTRAYETVDRIGVKLFKDPWAARNAYIDVLLERTQGSRDRFLATYQGRELVGAERNRALLLMELARHAMLMFTSCGWFFDELSGIETVQCLQYAARVTELIAEVTGTPIEDDFVERLAAARSNIPDEGDGRRVWQRRVIPARVDPEKVAAHVAVQTLVEPDTATSFEVYGYHVDFLDRVERRFGRSRLVAGTVRVRSQLTETSATLSFAGLHLGEQHVTGGVRTPPDERTWGTILDELTAAFKSADVFTAQRVIDRHFPGEAKLSLSSLLPGARERVLKAVLGGAIADAEHQFAVAYEEHAPLIRWLVAHSLPVPTALQTTAEAALRRRVLANLEADDASFSDLREQMIEANEVKVSLDTPEIALAASVGLQRLLASVVADDGELDPARIETAASAAEVAARMKSTVDLWFAQNTTHQLLSRLPAIERAGHAGDSHAQLVATHLRRLASALRLAIP